MAERCLVKQTKKHPNPDYIRLNVSRESAISFHGAK